MIGSGRDDDYKHDGFSHDATDFQDYFQTLQNIVTFYPESTAQMKTVVESSVFMKAPVFISLKR